MQSGEPVEEGPADADADEEVVLESPAVVDSAAVGAAVVDRKVGAVVAA